MESRNNKLFRLIICSEVIIIFIIVSLIINKSSIVINGSNEISNEVLFYNNIDKEISNLYDEYTSNIRKLEDKIMNGESDRRIAYLTFDDGPYKITDDFLKILKDNDVKATFFTIGKPDREEYYKRIVDEGHIIANHTYSHKIKNGVYKSADTFISDVKHQEDFIYNITGYKTTLVRLPGGSSQAGKLKNSIVNLLHENGYNYVDWNCETGDGSDKKMAKQGAFEWYKQTCTDDKKIIVLLMHDYNYSTRDNLDKIIKDLKSRGYILLPLHNKSIMVQ